MKKKMLIFSLITILLCSLFTPFSVSAANDNPTYTVLVLDISGTHKFYSSNKLIYTAQSAVPEAKQAAINFAKGILGLNANHHVAVVVYNSEAAVATGFTTDANKVINAINPLAAAGNDCDISTALNKADSLLSSVKDENAVKNVVLFTTGFTNVGAHSYSGKYNSSTPGSSWQNMSTGYKIYSYANSAYATAQKLHKYANVYTVGLFENWDGMPAKGQEIVKFFKMFTQDLANPLENYTPVYDKSDIDNAFAQIGNSIIGNPYEDVTYQGYYFDAVIWADEQGITTGTDINSFDPNAICTREQMVTFLWRAEGSPKPTSSTTPFTDVTAGTYSYDAIRWATENGVTKGTSTTTFSPKDTVTREQVVAFLWRMDGSPTVSTKNVFTDISSTSYSYNAILWAQANGITKGTTPTTFSPKDPCTRGQIITFMYRYYV